MPDPIIPDQQVVTPDQQVVAAEDLRLAGAMKKIQDLVLEARAKEAELAKKTSDFEQLQAQLAIKDVETTVAVSERDKKLQEILTAQQTSTAELARLQALELKLKVATKLGRPDLMKVEKLIPNMTDEAALETVMKDFLGFSDEAVKQREAQLMAGVIPTAGAMNAQSAAPASQEAWQKQIQAEPDNRKRAALVDQYGDWLQNAYAPRR